MTPLAAEKAAEHAWGLALSADTLWTEAVVMRNASRTADDRLVARLHGVPRRTGTSTVA